MITNLDRITKLIDVNEIQTQNTYIIDNQKYNISLFFINPDGSFVSVSKNSVKNLSLYDNVFNPHIKSSISFVDEADSFQRYVPDVISSEFNENLSLLKGYNFRGDGRDFLFVQIIPIDSPTSKSINEKGDKFNKTFAYRNIFICIDSEEQIIDNQKIKTFNLLDFDEKILREKKSFFSSSSVVENTKPLFLLSNKEREVETGKCIKKLLSDTLNTINDDQKNIIFTQGEDTPDFEDGISKIFYSSPANNSSYDDLMYLYDKHVSNNSSKDFSILKKENFTGFYYLKSVKNLFDTAYNSDDSAGFNNFEKIFISGEGSNLDPNNGDKRTPTNANASFGQYGEIQNINFFNTDSLINSDSLVTHSLHSYNYGEKKFNLNKNNSDISNAKNTFTENYVKNMKGDSNNPHPNLVLNETKSTNKSFKNIFSLYGDNDNIILGESLNKLLKTSIVTNLAAEITLKGQIFRKSGKFISIERDGNYNDNLFDDKFLGIYFILNIEHNFINDTQFNNKILAVKTYIYRDPKFNEQIL